MIYYKIIIVQDLDERFHENFDLNTIVGMQSDNKPIRTPNTLVIPMHLIENIKFGKTKITEIEHYIVDENGNCPLYEEATND